MQAVYRKHVKLLNFGEQSFSVFITILNLLTIVEWDGNDLLSDLNYHYKNPNTFSLRL